MYFAMDAAPVGWLKANGAVVSRTLYANLFAAIGTRFGAGDGKTTFNLPDLRGEFLRGWDDGRGLDSKRIFSSLQSDAVQDWTAGFTYQRATIRYKYEPIEGGFKFKEISEIGLGYPLDHPAGWAVGFGVLGPGINNVARTANETRPHNIALLACIKI
ncbi:MAG: tail fiber protein [Snodgrassella sp.]|nr:tail fiber protein [Snodgrassella sp.]MCO6522615.1 tail fiber protein [Snodgrassella sp.]MCO6526079.1 tail fiber protein [Snodgrassella sp.]